jgi:hypothetical protein
MVSGRIRQHRIIPTFINALPRAARLEAIFEKMRIHIDRLLNEKKASR